MTLQTPPVRLEDFGTVLTLKDLARLIQRSPRFLQEFITLENKTGVRCLPVEIPGLKHRYTKESVQRWLRTGVPQRAKLRQAGAD